MKTTAWLINTLRGPIVEEQALISALKNNQIAGVAIDVFDIEPLPPSHPFRTLDNVLATPHIAYVSHGLYKTFYEEIVEGQEIFFFRGDVMGHIILMVPLGLERWASVGVRSRMTHTTSKGSDRSITACGSARWS
jgi:lactate dehydrogenase-like 2-hydroxyacid dehydrogenase